MRLAHSARMRPPRPMILCACLPRARDDKRSEQPDRFVQDRPTNDPWPAWISGGHNRHLRSRQTVLQRGLPGQPLALRAIHGSMLRKGNCWENATAESLQGRLKAACVQGHRFSKPGDGCDGTSWTGSLSRLETRFTDSRRPISQQYRLVTAPSQVDRTLGPGSIAAPRSMTRG